MVSTQEIVERSVYYALLYTAKINELTLDPDDYLDINTGLPTPETQVRFNRDREAMEKFVAIFGIGNNLSRGQKLCPRITLDLQGYYPGHIGIEKYALSVEDKNNPKRIEYSSYTSKDIVIDVHLVANNQPDMRLLHSLMYKALPAMGYIKPYYNDRYEYAQGKISSTDNIFIEVGNYYDHNDVNHGILERVYSYIISDGIIEEPDSDMELVPIRDISVLFNNLNEEGIDNIVDTLEIK
jgi:hypothetical protein